jgi:hypothetical protein
MILARMPEWGGACANTGDHVRGGGNCVTTHL